MIVVGAALGLHVGVGSRSRFAEQAAATQPATAFVVPAGAVARYALHWRSDHSASIDLADGARELAFRGDLAGDLIVRGYGDHDGAALVGISLDALERHELTVLGARVADSAAALVGVEALVLVERGGTFRSVHFADGTNDLFGHVIMGVLASLETPLDPGADQPCVGPLGPSHVRVSSRGAPRDLERVRTKYLGHHARALAGTARVGIDSDGLWNDLDDEEHVHIDPSKDQAEVRADVTLVLRRRTRTRFVPTSSPAQLLAGTRVRRPGEVSISADAERRALIQRAGDLTRERLVADVRRFANLGEAPGGNAWLWQATGLVRLDPAAAGDLAAVVTSQALDAEGESFVLDVLAIAGSDGAQLAIREILAAPHIRDDAERYVEFVQRLGLVTDVAPESLAMVRELHTDARASGDADMAAATAYTLGAMASRLTGEDGDALAAMLASELRDARSPAERAALLVAIGNTGRTELVEDVVPYASDAQAEVRAAAARALRRAPVRAAIDVLTHLALDPIAQVQGSALSALVNHRLASGDLDALTEGVTSDRIDPGVDPTLVELARAHRAGTHPERGAAGRLLHAIADRTRDPDLRAHALAILAAG